ncbi:MAG: prepilin-type N-terminal cleavage/methylation domain-containing protein [Deltaproteobacteria bacterium]|jgi:prepilin-type N-terminal cleavage/methylation domain-containing protein|nr:prepilin-type N-terminal cleavage/methylation domain-containing protein [Deltaproteobacteria bacterium]
MISLFKNERHPGFTLMEMIVVIAVVAILVVISYPLLKASKPEYEARGAARQLEGMLQKAKLMAANHQRPIRIVINCLRPSGADNCYVDLQEGVYTEDVVSGWEIRPEERLKLIPEIRLVKTVANALYDGQVSVPNIFWVIFMPANNIFSDPRGFELFLYHQYQGQAEKNGWRLAINNVSGKIQLTQGTFTP